MYEYLKHMEYPPERGYDRKILESNCKIGRVNLKITRCVSSVLGAVCP